MYICTIPDLAGSLLFTVGRKHTPMSSQTECQSLKEKMPRKFSPSESNFISSYVLGVTPLANNHDQATHDILKLRFVCPPVNVVLSCLTPAEFAHNLSLFYFRLVHNFILRKGKGFHVSCRYTQECFSLLATHFNDTWICYPTGHCY